MGSYNNSKFLINVTVSGFYLLVWIIKKGKNKVFSIIS